MATVQDYDVNRRGWRYPIHTRGLASCRCKGCWAKRWWTPARRAARAADMSRQYAEGRRVWHPNSNLARQSHWLLEHDNLLRSLVGKYDLATVAETLTARTGVVRTAQSVKRRLDRLGISRFAARPLTTGEVARMFGMSRNNLLETWVRSGRLRPERWRGGQHGMLVYSRAELTRFVREHAESLNVARIRDSELRALAQATMRGRHGVGTRSVEDLTGVSSQVQAELYRAGLVPSARRVRRFGGGSGGSWMVDRGDVELVRHLAAERQAEHDRRRISRDRDDAGRYAGAAS
jgi:transposase-like protein